MAEGPYRVEMGVAQRLDDHETRIDVAERVLYGEGKDELSVREDLHITKREISAIRRVMIILTAMCVVWILGSVYFAERKANEVHRSIQEMQDGCFVIGVAVEHKGLAKRD